MTPVFMNPSSSPFSPDLVEQKDQSDRQHHLKFFLSPYNEEGSSSLSPSPTFFNSNVNQDQSSDVFQSNDEQLDQKDDNGSGKDGNSMINSGGGSVKYWMSSKMRLIQKMCNPEAPATTIVSTSTTGSDHKGAEKTAHKVLTTSPRKHKTQFTFNFCHGNNNNNSNNTGGVVRVCSDCNTTTTPLWRSGPRGPKSLCNACGIRRRKARRAMADAAAAAVANGIELAAADTAATINSSIKTTYNFNYKTRKYHITEEKKPSKNHKIAHYKGKFKLKLVNKATGNATSSPPTKSERISNNSELCFGHFSTFGPNDNKFFSGVFPQDVAEAAILLMELSCHGFVHS